MSTSWPGALYVPPFSMSLMPSGILEIPVGPPTSPESAADHVRYWQRLRPTSFMITGSQLSLYEQGADLLGVDLRTLTTGGVFAIIEASLQFPGPRQRIEEYYGVRVHNLGGVSELPGMHVCDCRHHDGIHAPADMVILQVCDPESGREVADGERGHLVLTCLDADNLWIRFDTEDTVVRHSGPCSCGETGPRYTYLGRDADGVQIGDRVVLPLDVQLALDRVGHPEFLIERSTDGILHLKLETESDGAAEQKILFDSLDVPISVQPVPEFTLPRNSFKPRRSS